MNMKKNIFLLSLVVFSCTATGDNKPPNDLIPPDQMSEVMTDIILMKNIKREASYIQDKEDLLVAEYLYEKHGIDSAQLASSQSYYAKNPKKYVPIFKKIQLELDRLNDSINESMRIKEE
jgi:hypothetical protein